MTGKDEPSSPHAFSNMAALTSYCSSSPTVLQPPAFHSWALQLGSSWDQYCRLSLCQNDLPQIITQPASAESQLKWPSLTTLSKSGLCHHYVDQSFLCPSLEFFTTIFIQGNYLFYVCLIIYSLLPWNAHFSLGICFLVYIIGGGGSSV